MRHPSRLLLRRGVKWLIISSLLMASGCARTQKSFHPPLLDKSEICTYSVKTVEYGTDGPSVDVGTEILDNGNIRITEGLYKSSVEVDSKTLVPIASEIHQTTVDGTVVLTEHFGSGGRLKFERKGPLSATGGEKDLGRTAYHMHTIFLLLRSVDLTRGNTIRFHLFSSYSQEAVLARISVEAFETVTVGEDTVESYRLLLRFEQYEVNAWVDATPQHQVLKFSNGIIELTLAGCR